MGNNEDYVDSLASEIMEAFSAYLNGKPNSAGGIFRAGTGSAMEYLFSAARVGATPDGRKAGQPYGSSFSPAITTKLEGPPVLYPVLHEVRYAQNHQRRPADHGNP